MYSGKKWQVFKSDKVISVCFATIQGMESLVGRFKESSVMLEDFEFRPRMFYTDGPLKGHDMPFPKPTDGSIRPKVDVLFSRSK